MVREREGREGKEGEEEGRGEGVREGEGRVGLVFQSLMEQMEEGELYALIIMLEYVCSCTCASILCLSCHVYSVCTCVMYTVCDVHVLHTG